MKVGTDGVLLGAWANLPEKGSSVLDVGAGTGLLSLMLTQRFPNAQICAVEIENSSCKQAKENFTNSSWGNRMVLHEISYQDFIFKSKNKFDLVISNPPYFKESLKIQNGARSLARHQDTLSLEELISGVCKLLNPGGLFSLILPFDQKNKCLKLAEEAGLFPQRILNISPKTGYSYIRTLLEFSFNKKEYQEDELSIELNGRHEYSEEYKKLTKDFYLKF